MLLLTGGDAWAKQKNNDIGPVVEYAVSHHIPVATQSVMELISWQRRDIWIILNIQRIH